MNDVREQVKGLVRERVLKQMVDRMWEQTEHQVGAQVSDHVWQLMRERIVEQIYTPIWHRVRNHVVENLEGEMTPGVIL
jgi:hypothetical protein